MRNSARTSDRTLLAGAAGLRATLHGIVVVATLGCGGRVALESEESAGSTGSGGATAVGGANAGGQRASGGAMSSTGGTRSTGGATSSGGAIGNGGAIATGARASTGGSVGAGGLGIGGKVANAGSTHSGGFGTAGIASGSGGAGGVGTAGSSAAGVPSAGTAGIANTAGRSAVGGAPSAGTAGIATAGTAAGGCPDRGGPTMVRVAEGYCVDTTEVTRAQYAAWLVTNPATVNSQDVATCGWNTTFGPDAGCQTSSSVCQGTGCETHPQVCVDWCDAYAYCQAMGKRLCGKIGGGAVDFNDFGVPAVSQWIGACSAQGQHRFPYGDVYQATACNGWDSSVNGTLPVGSLPGCRTVALGYAGIYDLSGNVHEWEDSCVAGASTATCRTQGGSFQSHGADSFDSAYMSCRGMPLGQARNYAGVELGFRCCSS